MSYDIEIEKRNDHNRPGHRYMRSQAEIDRAKRSQSLQQWGVTVFILLCLAVGAYLLISPQLSAPSDRDEPPAPKTVQVPPTPAQLRDESSPTADSAQTKAADARSSTARSDPNVNAGAPADEQQRSAASAAAPEPDQARAARNNSAAETGDGAAGSGAAQATARQPDADVANNAGAPASSEPLAKVVDAQFSYRVSSNGPGAPVDYIDPARLVNGQLFYFSRVQGQPGSRVTHQWRLNGAIIGTQRFEIGSPNVVLVSSQLVPEEGFGTWRVYVMDASGEVIKIGSALYEPR